MGYKERMLIRLVVFLIGYIGRDINCFHTHRLEEIVKEFLEELRKSQ